MDLATVITVAGVAVGVLAGYMTLLVLWLRTAVGKAEQGLRVEVAELRGEMRTGFARLHGEIGEVRGDLTRLGDRVERLEGRGPLVRP